jgi:twitching motility protein PilT
VISQTLLPRASGSGRVMACEVMVPNAAIRNLIREDKIHQIYSQMQVGQTKFGMQTLNQSLCELYLKRLITLEDCLARSSDQDELKTMIAAAQSGRGPSGPSAQAGRPGGPTYAGPRASTDTKGRP